MVTYIYSLQRSRSVWGQDRPDLWHEDLVGVMKVRHGKPIRIFRLLSACVACPATYSKVHLLVIIQLSETSMVHCLLLFTFDTHSRHFLQAILLVIFHMRPDSTDESLLRRRQCSLCRVHQPFCRFHRTFDECCLCRSEFALRGAQQTQEPLTSVVWACETKLCRIAVVWEIPGNSGHIVALCMRTMWYPIVSQVGYSTENFTIVCNPTLCFPVWAR